MNRTWYQPGSNYVPKLGDRQMPDQPFDQEMRVGDRVEIHPDSVEQDRFGTVTGFLRITVHQEVLVFNAALVHLPIANKTCRYKLGYFRSI